MVQLISQEALPTQRMVALVFMDGFGAEERDFVSLLAGPTVDAKKAEVLARMTAAENKVLAWAASAGQDLAEQLEEGAAKIAAAIADAEARGIRPPATA